MARHRQKRARWEVRHHRCCPVGLKTMRVKLPGSLGMRWASTMVVQSKVSTLVAACSSTLRCNAADPWLAFAMP